MILLNVRVLDRFTRKHGDAADWLAQWRETADAAEWRSLDDVRQVFASADGVPLKRGLVVTVFNVKGNEYRLITSIDYRSQRVYVLEVMTHAEYSRNRWKDRV